MILPIYYYLIGFIYLSNLESAPKVQRNYNDNLLSSELLKDYELFKSSLIEVHPGLNTYNQESKLKEALQRIEMCLDEQITSLEFYRLLITTLPLIGNNHTNILPPQRYINALKTTLPRLPLQLYHDCGKLYIRENVSKNKSIAIGDELITLDHKSSTDIINEMLTYESTDGFNKSLPLMAIGVAFSRRYGYYYDCKEIHKMRIKKQEGDTLDLSLSSLTYPEIAASFPHIASKRQNKELGVSIDGDIATLTIPSFLPDSEWGFNRKIKKIFSEIRKKAVSKLIIDVRNNGGGYGESTQEVIKYLISKEIHPYIDEYALVNKIPYATYFFKDMFFNHFKGQPLKKRGAFYHIKGIEKETIKPKENRFSGELYVLMNAASASATGEFLGLVKSYTNAVFIGEEAGGNPHTFVANDLLKIKLPHSNIIVTIPPLKTIMNTTFPNDGHGTMPDYEIIPDIQEIEKGTDAAMEYTLQMVRE